MGLQIGTRVPAPAWRLFRRALGNLRDLLAWPNVEGPTPRVRASTRPGRDLLLCGWYGTETLGDRAILAGLHALIRLEYPDIAIDVVSLRPYVTVETIRVMPELNIRSVLSVDEGARAAATGLYAAVAIAGDADDAIPEILDLLRLSRAARRGGARFGVLGCGIGPLEGPLVRRRAIARLVRDSRPVFSGTMRRRNWLSTCAVAETG